MIDIKKSSNEPPITPLESGDVRLPDKVKRLLWAKWTAAVLGGIFLFWLLALSIGYWYITSSLPKLDTLTDYQPLRVTEIYAQDLQKFAEYSTERRFVVDFEHIPQTLVHAVISSEDAHFFEHKGIDYWGIGRAFLKNLRAGRVVQGGSTITQQVAKSFLLSSERSFKRKIKEAFLALRIEKNLTKNDILYLYLNQIYLGHGAYGVQAAAQTYFNKDVKDLTLAECALLAGLPQAPSRFSPFNSGKSSKERQAYVLERMLHENFITEDNLKNAQSEELKIYFRNELHFDFDAPDYAEHVRRYVQEKYGTQALYENGLQIYTSLDLNKQKPAQEAVRKGLRELDRRQGYRGVLGHVDLTDTEAVKKFLAEVHEQTNQTQYFILPGYEDVKNGILKKDLSPPKTPLKEGEFYRALVIDFDNGGNYLQIAVGTETGRMQLEDMKWAREPNTHVKFEEAAYYVKDPRKKFQKGDIILVSFKKLNDTEAKSKKYDKEVYYFSLEQEPLVQGALLSLDPTTGFVLAMVGGYDFKASEFNRAVQSLRQPGSSFKPIMYAAALDKGYTASSIIVDSPIVYESQSTKEEELLRWRPKNYGSKFHGDTPLRTGLVKSMNVITIKLLREIGINYVSHYARKLGITSALAPDLSLALGSSDVSLLELTNAYAVFAQGGKKREPVFITKILDGEGNVLERHTEEDTDLSQREGIDWLKKRVGDLFLENKVSRGNVLTAASPVQAEQVTLNPGATPGSEPVENQIANANEPLPDYVKKSGLNRKEWEILYEKSPAGYVISPQTAYLMTYLLTHVVQYGTGQRVKVLPRPAAGKTGTTNDEYDAWFIGFTPDLVTGVWVGYDQKKQIGAGETGGHAAAPLWLYYMQEAVKDTPYRNFEVPPGIVFVTINKKTGLLADAKTPPDVRVISAYLEGTEPKASEPTKTQTPEIDEFMLMDSHIATP